MRILLAPCAGLLALAAAGGAQAASSASALLYERSLMLEAGARCPLFTPAVTAALAAARGQARGAALRAGDAPAALDATEARAGARARAVDCRDAGLGRAAARVREAFAGYSRMATMRFPGPRSAWLAERPSPQLKGARWSLVQALPGSGGWLLFGVTAGRPALLDARRGAGAAASARLALRDPARSPLPYRAGPPPPAIAQSLFASGRSAAERTLLPAGATSGTLYAFPAAALDALAALDASETATLELAYPAAGPRGRTATAQIEVGDLAAARAFLAAGGG